MNSRQQLQEVRLRGLAGCARALRATATTASTNAPVFVS
jgi:hypothetical protein